MTDVALIPMKNLSPEHSIVLLRPRDGRFWILPPQCRAIVLRGEDGRAVEDVVPWFWFDPEGQDP